MPQPKLYLNRAAQQAAYRQRQATARRQQLAQRSLPQLPALPTVPGRHRWQALLELAQWATQTIVDERQDYFDERPEEWQDSDRGDDLSPLTTENERPDERR